MWTLWSVFGGGGGGGVIQAKQLNRQPNMSGFTFWWNMGFTISFLINSS